MRVNFGRELRHRASFHQRGADGIANKIVQDLLLAEADLGLRRMDIDVHFSGGHF